MQYTKEKIAQIVQNILVEQLGVNDFQVKPETLICRDLGADSLDTVELLMAFEEELNISIDDGQIEQASSSVDGVMDMSVAKLADFLYERVEQE